MIVLNMPQGSPEWLAARLGIPTASRFGEIVTYDTRKYSASVDRYINDLCAEWATGYPVERADSGFMERGRELEPEARAWYTLQLGARVRTVGFVMRDDGLTGGSPDGLTDGGGCEIKCPSPAVHIGYLRGGAHKYQPQIQGLIYLTGSEWWDFVSYHPSLPCVLARVPRDAKYIAALVEGLDRFNAALQETKDTLRARGVTPPPTGNAFAMFAVPMTDAEVRDMANAFTAALEAGRIKATDRAGAAAAVVNGEWAVARTMWRDLEPQPSN